MTITIDLQPEAEARLRERAAGVGAEPGEYAAGVLESALSGRNTALSVEDSGAFDAALSRWLHRPPEDREALRLKMQAYIIPGRPLPPGKTLEDVLVGQWPGEETDEQIYSALKSLS